MPGGPSVPLSNLGLASSVPPDRMTYERNPDILLLHRQPGLPIRSFEGLAGAVIPGSGKVVTTPNIDIVYAPSDICVTRMRHDFSWGKDDPLLFPQPFHSSVNHYAVLPVPFSLPDRELAWYRPIVDDFVVFNGWTGLGTLKASLNARLRLFSSFLMAELNISPVQVQQDNVICADQLRLQQLTEQLDLPVSQSEAFFRLSELQRVYLDLFSRRQWLEVYAPRLKSGTYTSVDRHVMGAFTEDLAIADELFRMGIPVWLVRDVASIAGVRIDTLANLIDESANFLISVRDSDCHLDVHDAKPPHPTVFEGLPGKSQRYIKMRHFMRNLFSYSILGTWDGPSADVGLASASTSTSSVGRTNQQTTGRMHIDTAGTGLVKMTGGKKKSTSKKPYSKPMKSPALPPRNKFIPLDCPYNPPVVPAWFDAMRELEELATYLPSSTLKNFVPDPEMLIGSSVETTRSRLIVSWLKIRPVFLYRLSTSTYHALILSNHEWRSMLEQVAGINVKHGTETSKTHEAVRSILSTYVNDPRHGVDISLESLSVALATWKGVEIQAGEQLSHRIIKEILWELYEVSFRMEFRALDRFMLPNVLEEVQDRRSITLSLCWSYRVDVDHADKGLTSIHIKDRHVSLRYMFDLMKDWPGAKAAIFNHPFPKLCSDGGSGEAAFLLAVTEIEAAMARFYVRSFVNSFHRPPIVPHNLC